VAAYVAFLRGINLGNRRVKMAELARLFEEMNFGAVSTFIASGNVLFESDSVDHVALERQIEGHLESALGYSVDTFVRTRDEVAAVVDACAAIEVVHSRYSLDRPLSNLEKLADSIMNGALVCAEPNAGWRDLDLGKIKVTLTVNGLTDMDKNGGHPLGDPLGVAVAMANMWREKGGVRAGQIVTCGSYTGLKYLKPGDACGVTFEGLGSAAVRFTV
jgi:uncharacterized protein (DUF1697 family)